MGKRVGKSVAKKRLVSIDADDVSEKAVKALDAFITTAALTMNYTMQDVENWGKGNAPWTDRTTMARRSIYAHTESVGATKSGVRIRGRMGIVVWYGIFLELANGGRFRIVGPMLERAKQVFKENFKKVTQK